MNVQRITVREIRQTGHCVRGIKTWFTSHGYDFKQVVREGVSIEEIRALNDGLGDQVVDAVLENRKKDNS